MTTWLEAKDEPCKFGCAVWIGRHFHSLLEDGTLGIVVSSEEPPLYVADITVEERPAPEGTGR